MEFDSRIVNAVNSDLVTQSTPQTSHPFLLGKFALADMDKQALLGLVHIFLSWVEAAAFAASPGIITKYKARLSCCLPLEVKGNAQCKNQGRNREQGQDGRGVGFFNDDLPRHGDERNFQDDAHMNDVFLQVRFQRLQQLHSDQHQQEVSEDFEKTLHRDEKPGRLPYFFTDQQAQVRRGEHHDDDEHSSKHQDRELLDLR